MDEKIQYLLYGIVVLQLVGIIITFFVRNYFERQQKDIDRMQERIEATCEHIYNLPITGIEQRVKSCEEDIREIKEGLEYIRRKNWDGK